MMEKSQKNEKFAERLYKLRSSLPLIDGKIISQKIVAERVGISEGSYNRAERGYIPGKSVLYSLSEYFNKTVDFLKYGKEDKAQATKPPIAVHDYDEQYGAHMHQNQYNHKPNIHPFDSAILGLRKIFDSHDPALIAAILANIKAFEISAQLRDENIKLNKRLENLEDTCDQLIEEIKTLKQTCPKCPTQDPIGESTRKSKM